MEVGVCVEAYRQEAETQRRHINSAFMTFVVLDKDDQPQKLPWIRPQPGVSALSPTSSLVTLCQSCLWLFTEAQPDQSVLVLTQRFPHEAGHLLCLPGLEHNGVWLMLGGSWT